MGYEAGNLAGRIDYFVDFLCRGIGHDSLTLTFTGTGILSVLYYSFSFSWPCFTMFSILSLLADIKVFLYIFFGG